MALKKTAYQHRRDRDSDRIRAHRAERAHLADLSRFKEFGPTVYAAWIAFLGQQSYHVEWSKTPKGRAALEALDRGAK